MSHFAVVKNPELSKATIDDFLKSAFRNVPLLECVERPTLEHLAAQVIVHFPNSSFHFRLMVFHFTAHFAFLVEDECEDYCPKFVRRMFD